MSISDRIKQKANDIRTKIYGQEVRESLASGLEEMSEEVQDTIGRQDHVESQFQDVIDETTGKDVIAAPEIIAARNGEPNLKARLDKNQSEVTSQLAHKIGRDENESVTKAMLSQDIKEEINNGEIEFKLNTSEIENNAITNKKISINTITSNETDFVTVASNNLFDKSAVSADTNINTMTGEPIEFAGQNLSEFIKVKPNASYAIENVVRIAFYDGDYKFNRTIANLNITPLIVETTEKDFYMRVVFLANYLGTVKINEGTEHLPYDNYKESLVNVIPEEGSVSTKSLEENVPLDILFKGTTSLIKGPEIIYGDMGIRNANDGKTKNLSDRIIIPKDENIVANLNGEGQFKTGEKYNFVFKTNTTDDIVPNSTFRINKKDSSGSIINRKASVYMGSGIYAILDYEITNEFNHQLAILNESSEQFIVEKTLITERLYPIDGEINGNAIRYVTQDGSDDNDGLTETTAFATFQKAVDDGATIIYAESGDYIGQSLKVHDRESFEIKVLNGPYNKEDLEKPKARLINAEDLSFAFDDVTNLYKTNLLVDTTSNFHKVFIERSLPITPRTPKGPSYNAVLWETNDSGLENDTKLKPVLDLEVCQNEQGTFFYDGEELFLNPTNGSTEGKKYKKLVKEEGPLVDIYNVRNKVVIEDLAALFGATENILITKCNDVTQTHVETGYSAYNTGNKTRDSNAKYYKCLSYKNEYDGFAPASMAYGDVHFFDCEAYYNYDDGISHHDNATGSIVGGEFHHNGKAGIAPTYGSAVDVYNTISHNNRVGILASGGPDANPGKTVRHVSNVCFDNEVGMEVAFYHVLSFNCKYDNNAESTRIASNEYTSLTIL